MEVDCEHSQLCSDVNKLCNSCQNNRKRSYYRPYRYEYPYSPWDPYFPYWTTTMGGTGDVQSHYQATT